MAYGKKGGGIKFSTGKGPLPRNGMAGKTVGGKGGGSGRPGGGKQLLPGPTGRKNLGGC